MKSLKKTVMTALMGILLIGLTATISFAKPEECNLVRAHWSAGHMDVFDAMVTGASGTTYCIYVCP